MGGEISAEECAKRADRAEMALCFYDDGPEDGGVRDLLADLMHLCAEEGVDFERELAVARTHFDAERE